MLSLRKTFLEVKQQIKSHYQAGRQKNIQQVNVASLHQKRTNLIFCAQISNIWKLNCMISPQNWFSAMPLNSMHQPVLSFSRRMLVLSSEGPLLSGLFMSNLISDSPQNQGIWDGLNKNSPPVQLTRLKHRCQQIKSKPCQTCQVQLIFIIHLGNSKRTSW